MTVTQAAEYEAKLLAGNSEKTWQAMCKAGEAVGINAMQDFNELRTLPRNPHILTLVGKGHNGGDAILATLEMLRERPRGKAVLVFVFGESPLKPLAQQALATLLQAKGDRIHTEYVDKRIAGKPEEVLRMIDSLAGADGFDFCIDGMLGMQYKPPMREPLATILPVLNEHEKIAFRVAVDLPSGIYDESCDVAFRADFTYATGIAKSPLFKDFNQKWVGRPRYLDIGFFDELSAEPSSGVLLESGIAPLQKLRPATCDKRSFGHLLVVAGSKTMPGALLMNVRSALHSGVGLVTAFAPESVSSAFAAVCPEAMWVPCKESADGTLCKSNADRIVAKAEKATALLCGSGMGTAQPLLIKILSETKLPAVLDADALEPEVIASLGERRTAILTPHKGEYQRIAGDAVPADYAKSHPAMTLILKSPVTQIFCQSQNFYSLHGGPLLARGGSGDVLAGLAGGLLAQAPDQPLDQAAKAVLWQGMAADALAKVRGQTAVTATSCIDFLHKALR